MTGTTEIAVTGATGALGGRVARRLAERGVAQRLVVRDPSRAPELAQAQVATGEYSDGEAMRRALDGVRTLFLVSGSEAADRLDQHKTAIDAAVAAGVERVVYTSFLAAAPDATFTFARDHYHTEQHLRAAGLSVVSLRDGLYADFLPYFAVDGVIRGPAGDGQVAPVARDDTADVAVAALLDPAYDGATFDVTGPELLTMDEIAHLLTDVTGRLVHYEAETLDEAYASRANYGAPDWEVAGWVTTYAAIATGELAIVADTVERVTGHSATAPGDFLRSALADDATGHEG
jgi:NAD(P)H dehydrogenase (quinone)